MSETIVVIDNWRQYSRGPFTISPLKSSVVSLGIEETDFLETYKEKSKLHPINLNGTIANPLPAKKIMIAEYDVQLLPLILHKLRHSVWWNVNGCFLIKNIQTPNSCKLAHSVFKSLWSFNILSVVFLCHHSKFGISLFTFNPYYSVAPAFWKVFKRFREENGHQFTLFINTQQGLIPSKYTMIIMIFSEFF